MDCVSVDTKKNLKKYSVDCVDTKKNLKKYSKDCVSLIKTLSKLVWSVSSVDTKNC